MKDFLKKNFDIGSYIGKGFDLFKKNPTTFIIFTIVFFLITITIGLIPMIGQLINATIGSAISVGFFILAHRSEKGDTVSLADGFDGLKTKLVPFVIYGLIYLGVFILLFLIIGGTTFFQNLSDPNAIVNFLATKGIFLFGIIGLISIVLFLCFIYAPMFIYFENMSAIEAIKSSFTLAMKNPLKLFLFVIVGGILVVISTLLLFVGVFAGLPIFYNSLYAAWKDQSGYQDDDIAQERVIDNLV